jgi:hypothetical protein
MMWKKYSTAEQATDDNIIWRMRIACCIPKATNIAQNMSYLLLLQGNDGYANAPRCYVYTYIACLV